MEYGEVVAALEATGMVARGGFPVLPSDGVPEQPDGSPTRTVVVIGNVGSAMWAHFRAADQPGADPLDTWTRSVLTPIAARLGATFVHPSDEPFQPFLRWARRAEGIHPSPIGMLIHPEHGLWHAYRGAFLFPFELDGVPDPSTADSPCISCRDQPCLSTCPVGAFSLDGYDAEACRGHVRSGHKPHCMDDGCAARCACPVGADNRYGTDQMRFHMRAFVGDP